MNDVMNDLEQKRDDAERDRQIVARFKRLGSNNQKLGFLYRASATEAAAILNSACASGVNPFERGIAEKQLENLAARARVAEKAREISAREKV